MSQNCFPGLLRFYGLRFRKYAPIIAIAVALSFGSSTFAQQASISFAGAHSTLASGFSATPGLPTGLAVDNAGDVFIADTGNHQVVEIPAQGGAPIQLSSGFVSPTSVAVDAAGNVYVADSGGPAVFEIPAGTGQTQPVIVNSGLIQPVAVALDAQGDLFILDAGNASVLELPVTELPVGGAANTFVYGLQLSSPTGMAVDSVGDVFISDSSLSSVVEVLPDGSLSSVGTGLSSPMGVALDAGGDVFIANGNAGLVELPANGAQTALPFSGQVPTALGVTVDGKGGIFVADTASDGQLLELQIAASVNFGSVSVTTSSRLMTLNYSINSTVSFGTLNITTQGSPNLDFTASPTSSCTGSLSSGICSVPVSFAPGAPGVRPGAVQLYDSSSPGNLLATTFIHGIGVGPQIAFGSAPQTTVANGTGANFTGVALDGASDVFYTEASTTSVLEVQAGGAQTSIGSQLTNPNGAAVDGAGNLFIANGGTSSILEIPAGASSQATVAAGLSSPAGVAVDGAGDVFIAENSGVVEIPAGGGAQIQIGTGLSSPNGVALDGSGNAFIADTLNGRVVEVPAGGGTQTSVASGLASPMGVAVDAAANVYIADPSLASIVEVPAGGGPQVQVGAGLTSPTGVAVDAAGDVFIAASNQIVEVLGSQAPALTFSAIPVNTTSTPQIVSLQNIGNTPLNLFGISVPADSSFMTDPGTTTCSTTTPLSPGGTCNVGVVCAPTATGTVTDTLNLADNALNALSAVQAVSLTCTGVLQAQTISFTTLPPATATYGTGFQVGATGSGSGNPVVFSSSGACTNVGPSYTMSSGTGTCLVIASQAGDSSYAAAQVTLNVTAVLATNTVKFTIHAPATAAYLSSFTVAASGGGSTNPIIYESYGACGNSGTTYSMINGKGQCNVTAFQFGDGNYDSGTVTEFTVATLASQTIVFTTNAPASAAYGTSFAVAATGGSSGNPIVFTSSGACTNNGIAYKMTSGTGTCQVIANQAGRVVGDVYEYAAAPAVTETTTATPASQTISFTTNAPASAVYGSSFTVAAKSSAGLPIAYSSAGSCSNTGAVFTITSGTGTCSATASQSGNNNYSAASPATESTTATKVSQSVTFSTNPPSTAVYGASFVVAANASSGLAVVYTSSGSCTNSGPTYTMTSGTGTCSVIANQPGNANYSAAGQVTKSTTAQKAAATVSISNIPANAFVGASFSPAYVTNSNGSPSATSSTSTTCTVSGNTVTFKAAGTCTLAAHTASTGNFNAGTGTSQSFTIIQPTLTSINPTSGTHGTTVPVTLTGTNLTSATAITVSGTGVTVNGLSVTGSTTIKANLVIASTATLSTRTVKVTTPIGTTNTVSFTVK